MKKSVPVLFGLLLIAAIVSLAQSGESGDELAYLPLVTDDGPTATPTTMPTATATATPTATPTSEPLPPVTTGDVRITDIFFDGVVSSQEPDEYVVIRNFDAAPVQLEGWTLRDGGSSPKIFTFPNYTLQPNESCRIYTNELHPETCGFSFNNSAAIWNNGGDCGTLRNQAGTEIDEYCYD